MIQQFQNSSLHAGGAHEITLIYNISLPERKGAVECYKEWWREVRGRPVSEKEIVSSGQHFQMLIIITSGLNEKFANSTFVHSQNAPISVESRFREFPEPFPDIVNSAILNIRSRKNIRKDCSLFFWFSQDSYTRLIDNPEYS